MCRARRRAGRAVGPHHLGAGGGWGKSGRARGALPPARPRCFRRAKIGGAKPLQFPGGARTGIGAVRPAAAPGGQRVEQPLDRGRFVPFQAHGHHRHPLRKAAAGAPSPCASSPAWRAAPPPGPAIRACPLVEGVVVGIGLPPGQEGPGLCKVEKNLRGLAMPQKAKTGWPASSSASAPAPAWRAAPAVRRQLRQGAGLVLADQHGRTAARGGIGHRSRSGPAGITRPLPKP